MRQRIILTFATLLLWIGTTLGQEKPVPHGAARVVFDGRIATVRLAQHFTTTIRLPEPVSSVIIGDPGLFQAEHSPNEPLLVFVKPISAIGESNILISTNIGRQFSLLLRTGTESGQPKADFDLLVVCRSTGSTFIEESFPTSLIAETITLGARTSIQPVKGASELTVTDRLSALMERQRVGPLPELQGERLKVGIGQVEHHGAQFVVPFSVLNTTNETVELMTPQIQMAGRVKSGLLGNSSHWTTVDQIPVLDFWIDKRKLAAGARTDGVVLFGRPTFKQSNESLLLQIAEAARVDQPVLVPIRFSVNTNEEENHD
jgi:hypothetical protein